MRKIGENIVNKVVPYQNKSDQGLHCLPVVLYIFLDKLDELVQF